MDSASEHEMLIPTLIDHRATISPDRLFCYLPKGDQLEDGFFPLTYSELAKAVDATALWLDQELGTLESGSAQTVPYIGANDFRYALLLFACIKSGRCFMTPLLFNTTEGLVKLLADCTTVLTCPSHHHHWEGAKEKIPNLRIVNVPPVETFIRAENVPKYPFTKEYPQAPNDVVYKIQTSGTTGSPKSIDIVMKGMINAEWTRRNERATADNKLAMPELYKNDCYTPNLLPLSWGAGLLFVTTTPLRLGNVPIMLPSTAPQPITPEHVIQIMKFAPRGKKNGLIWVPSGLKQLVRTPAGLDGLKHYDWVAYAGAPLDHATGDLISTFTRVQSLMGDTSVGGTPLLLNDPADWKIHRLGDYDGFFFEKFTDDLYELCVKRQEDDRRACFSWNPEMDVYHTRDLWRKVQDRPDFWETAGRMDDFVKLASMTKFNAIEFEQKLESHSGVVRALVAGDARAKPFAIVELGASGQSPSEVIAAAVGLANVGVFEEVQLSADLVVIADASRSIKRTDKGSTDRRSTIAMYAEEIEELYEKAGFVQ